MQLKETCHPDAVGKTKCIITSCYTYRNSSILKITSSSIFGGELNMTSKFSDLISR